MLLVTIILLVIGIALIVAGGVIIAQSLSEYGKGFTPGKTITAVVTIVLGAALTFMSMGLTEVGPGQVGVKVRFGQVQQGTLPPGLHWLFPMVESATIFDGRVQAYNFENIAGATRDLQAVGLSGLINYRIDATKADEILQTIGGPDVYAQTVFLRPSNTALKEITPRYNAAEVIGKRDEIGRLTLANLQERMAPFGIIVERVSVENVSLNQAFLDSVEQKQIAQQALERADFERQTAVKQAEGVRDARITVAEGEAQANDLINDSLTPELLQWATIQKLAEDIKVMLLPSDQGLILDIGQAITPDQ